MGRVTESIPAAIGILGGTFDPPHLGHLILAQSAIDALELSQVLFIPAADPPHKKAYIAIEHRAAMVKAAIQDNPQFTFSDVDMTRPGPHYTVGTLEILRHQYPHSALYFLIGGDSLHNFMTWHNPAGIIARAKLAVVRREDATFDLNNFKSDLPDIEDRVVFVHSPIIGISASILRERVKSGFSIRYQVPDAVDDYIKKHQLYKE